VLWQRGLRLGIGAMFTVGGLWGGLWTLLLVGIAAQPPDAQAMDGDPCCPVPDSWWQVAVWSVLALITVAVDAGVLVLGAAFMSCACRGRWPDGRLVRVPLGAAAAGAGLIVLGIAARGVLR
jgi:hypothetical protein